MSGLGAPLVVAGLLLAVAGVPKLARPASTVGALRSVGVRVPAAAVRVLGVAEAAIGLFALTGSRPAAALVAAAYAGFTGFLVVALRRGGAVSSCGCVGRPDTPPTPGHLVLTAGFALAAAAAAVWPPGPPVATDASLLEAALVVAVCAVAVRLAWAVLSELPRLSPAARRAAARRPS